MAEKRRPWGKWFWGDWRKDTRLHRCSYAARGLWADMLSLMGGECDRFGYLVMEGQALAAGDLAGMFGGSEREVKRLLGELAGRHVFNRIGDADLPADLMVANDLPVGTIFSRRMLRDKAKEEFDRANGKNGGNPSLKPDGERTDEPDKGGVNPPVKAQNQKPELEPKKEDHHPLASEKNSDECTFGEICKLLGYDPGHANWIEFIRLRMTLDVSRETIFAAAEHHKRVGKPGNSIAYLRPKALELKAEGVIAASAPIIFVDCDDDEWRGRLQAFRNKAIWTAAWGPTPTEPSCKAPADILANFTHPQRQKASA